MTRRNRLALAGVFGVLFLLVAPLACDETPSDRKDGQSCSDDGDCESARCVSSTCAGSSCTVALNDCEEGWDCTRATAGATEGTCQELCGGNPAADPCPDGRYCASGYCREGDAALTVAITTSGVCNPGRLCTLSVQVSNGSGKLSSIVVDWDDDSSDTTFTEASTEWTAASGTVAMLVTHTYAEAGAISPRATATDVRDGTQTDTFDTLVCIANNDACTTASSCCGGNCCGGVCSSSVCN